MTKGSEPSNDKEQSGPKSSGLDELAERLAATEAVSEDMATVIAQNWKKLIGCLAIVLLLVVVIGEARSARIVKHEEMADRFVGVQGMFSKLSGLTEQDEKGKDADSKEQESLRVSYEDNLRALSEDGSGAYGVFPKLYRAAYEISNNKIKEAQKLLLDYNVDLHQKSSSASAGSEITSDALADELASLLYARTLLADPKADIKEARERLRSLALKASVVNVEALIALVRLADTEIEREESMNNARTLIEKRPELGDFVRQELSALGLDLGQG